MQKEFGTVITIEEVPCEGGGTKGVVDIFGTDKAAMDATLERTNGCARRFRMTCSSSGMRARGRSSVNWVNGTGLCTSNISRVLVRWASNTLITNGV